jgi:PrmC N-terminal domain
VKLYLNIMRHHRHRLSRSAFMLRSLERAIGRESANLEFKWMLENGGSIKEMLKRRLKGEPLQYILGMPYIYPLGSDQLINQ